MEDYLVVEEDDEDEGDEVVEEERVDHEGHSVIVLIQILIVLDLFLFIKPLTVAFVELCNISFLK